MGAELKELRVETQNWEARSAKLNWKAEFGKLNAESLNWKAEFGRFGRRLNWKSQHLLKPKGIKLRGAGRIGLGTRNLACPVNTKETWSHACILQLSAHEGNLAGLALQLLHCFPALPPTNVLSHATAALSAAKIH